jgi:hypothetical protein
MLKAARYSLIKPQQVNLSYYLIQAFIAESCGMIDVCNDSQVVQAGLVTQTAYYVPQSLEELAALRSILETIHSSL